MSFRTVAPLSALSPGEALSVRAGDVLIALFNVGGTVYALDNVCPHAGAPLARGTLGGPDCAVVTCPLHGWRFDVRTGRSTHLPGEAVRTYPARVIDEQIVVELPDQLPLDDAPS